MKEYKNDSICPESKGLNGGLHLMITSPMNGRRRKICLMCSEIIEDNN